MAPPEDKVSNFMLENMGKELRVTVWSAEFHLIENLGISLNIFFFTNDSLLH